MQGTPIRKQANSLILNALAYPHLYDYSMLIKLLINYFGNFASIETKPSLNLAFNASDVQNIEIFDLNQVIETQDKAEAIEVPVETEEIKTAAGDEQTDYSIKEDDTELR